MADARSVNRRTVLLAAAGTLTAATARMWLGRSHAAAVALAMPSPTPSASTSPSAFASPVPRETPQGRDAKRPQVWVQAEGWYSWALMDRSTGAIFSAANAGELNNTASMIKAWIAADYLSRTDNPGQDSLDALSAMIRDSANDPASDFFDELGAPTRLTG
jgi:hypothetical protein